MRYDPDKHHRRSIRLKGYDYSQADAYFVTICTQDRACLFGKVVDGEMRLNDAGEIVRRCWLDIPVHFPHTALDEFVVMPNHMHGIVWIVGDYADDVGARHAVPLHRYNRRKSFVPAGGQRKSAPQRWDTSPSRRCYLPRRNFSHIPTAR